MEKWRRKREAHGCAQGMHRGHRVGVFAGGAAEERQGGEHPFRPGPWGFAGRGEARFPEMAGWLGSVATKGTRVNTSTREGRYRPFRR